MLSALSTVSGCDTTNRFGSKIQLLKPASESLVQTALSLFPKKRYNHINCFCFNLVKVICTSDTLLTVQTFIWKNSHQT